MQNIPLRSVANHHPRGLLRLARLQPGDGYFTHHIYRGRLWEDGSGWNFGPYNCQPWSAGGTGRPPGAWAYVYMFADGTLGVSRVCDVNEALAALGYDVDRRGDAPGD